MSELSMSEKIEYLKQHLTRPVVFVGMMGTGKSKIGGIFAQAVGLPFLDSDALIVQKAGMPISEIFTKDGEAHFRQLEREAIQECFQSGRCVIATGGGAVTNAETLATIKDNAISVWMNVETQELLTRIGDVSSRPLLTKGAPATILNDLKAKRAGMYAQANIHIDSTGLQPAQTLEKLINSLYDHLNPANV